MGSNENITEQKNQGSMYYRILVSNKPGIPGEESKKYHGLLSETYQSLKNLELEEKIYGSVLYKSGSQDGAVIGIQSLTFNGVAAAKKVLDENPYLQYNVLRAYAETENEKKVA